MKTDKVHFLLLLILASFLFFANNTAIPADYMESRNLATAQEMVATGNYLIPTMNGELRLEKPPLPTWIAAAVEHIFTGSLAAQRVATGLAGMLLMVFVYGVVYEMSQRKRQAFLSAAVLVSSYAIIMMSRNATWDIYCHSFMLGGIYFFIRGLKQERISYLPFVWTGVFWGLSFLAKGPVSFFALLLPFLIAYFYCYRPVLKNKWKPICATLLITLVISGAWPLYVFIHEHQHLQFVAQKESAAWGGHNVRPWHYYKLFFVESGIWSLFWITALLYAIFAKSFKQSKSARFFLVWTLAVLLLLSLVPEKKTRYLLPILIPGAMNLGAYWEYLLHCKFKSKWDKHIFKLNTGILIIVFLAIPALLYFIAYKQNLIGVYLYSSLSILFLVLAALLISAIIKKRVEYMSVFNTLLLAMVVVTTLALIPAKRVFINSDRHSIRELRGVEALNPYPFYHPQEEFLRMELVYESNRIIRPLDLSHLDSLQLKCPFILVSTKPVESFLPAELFKFTPIGKYDNNWRQEESKRYNPELVKEVNLIELK